MKLKGVKRGHHRLRYTPARTFLHQEVDEEGNITGEKEVHIPAKRHVETFAGGIGGQVLHKVDAKRSHYYSALGRASR